MRGVIMAGGFGTRLRPLTCNIPKPMVPMANAPLMERIINLLRDHSITDIVAILYYQAEEITEYFGDGDQFGVKLSYIGAEADYGTAGSVKNAESFLNEPFLIISGDVLTDFDLKDAIAFHRRKRSTATMILTRVINPLDYGVVIVNEDGRINRFLEKPSWGDVFSDTINTGIYILEPDVLNFIPSKQMYDFSKDLFPLLLHNNHPLYGYIAGGYWKDVGNLEEYRLGHKDILAGKVNVTFSGAPKKYSDGILWLAEGSSVEESVSVVGTNVVGRNCRIHAEASLVNSIIGNDCVIERGTAIYNSVIWNNVTIGRHVRLKENVIGSNCELGDRSFVLEDTIVSDGCKIGQDASIRANVKLWPGKVVQNGAELSSSLVWGDRWDSQLFTGSRITGISNWEVTPEFAAKLGAAFGAYLGKGKSVALSRDSHNASRMVERALVSGLLCSGGIVNDLRTLPIPLLRYHLRASICQSGIHIRCSPFEENLIDIIFFNEKGGELHPSRTKAIERLFFREDFRRAEYNETGEIIYPYRVLETYKEDFLKEIHSRVTLSRKLNIVIDFAFGSASNIFPSVFGYLGCDVVSLNSFLDPQRITKTKKDFAFSLVQLSNIVKSLHADLGFLMDTGAEKIFVIDEKGRILTWDTTFAAVVSLVLRSGHAEKVVVPVTASRVIEEMASHYGTEIVRIKEDNHTLMEAALENGVYLAAERKGGYIFPEFQPAFDAMYAIAKIVELLNEQDICFGQIVDELPPIHLYSENISCPNELKGTIMRKMIEFTGGEKRVLIDGVKVFYKKDWVLVRPDNNRPLIHVNAEADDYDTAENMAKKFISRVQEWMP
jgi:mannose-1-phosphate guanylyltransferase/phosphomannomutase